MGHAVGLQIVRPRFSLPPTARLPICREAQGAPTPSPSKLSSATVRADLVVRARGGAGGGTGPLARLQAATACRLYVRAGASCKRYHIDSLISCLLPCRPRYAGWPRPAARCPTSASGERRERQTPLWALRWEPSSLPLALKRHRGLFMSGEAPIWGSCSHGKHARSTVAASNVPDGAYRAPPAWPPLSCRWPTGRSCGGGKSSTCCRRTPPPAYTPPPLCPPHKPRLP